jgi:hypothetical protein
MVQPEIRRLRKRPGPSIELASQLLSTLHQRLAKPGLMLIDLFQNEAFPAKWRRQKGTDGRLILHRQLTLIRLCTFLDHLGHMHLLTKLFGLLLVLGRVIPLDYLWFKDRQGLQDLWLGSL